MRIIKHRKITYFRKLPDIPIHTQSLITTLYNNNFVR